MIAIGISTVKNEEDIIESFVRCNLEFLDGMIISNNMSTDGTREILISLMREGLPICVSDDNEIAYLQSEKLTNLFQRVGLAFPIKYVIPLDADEFIECSSRDEFRTALDSIPDGSVGSWSWKTYLLSPDLIKSQEAEILPEEFHYYRDHELPAYEKVIIKLDSQNFNNITLSNGSHKIFSPDPIPVVHINIPLAHFPVRKKNQVYKKCASFNVAYTVENNYAKYDKNAVRGFQTKTILSRILQGEDFSETDMCNISLNYAQMPGDLIWPENTNETVNNLHKTENKYNQQIRNYEPFVDLLRNYQNFLRGPIAEFNPEEMYPFEDTDMHGEGSSETTAFDPSWHKVNLLVDIPPYKYLYDRFSPDSILDIGCGLGAYPRLLSNLGVSRAVGVDNIKAEALFIPSSNYILHDLSLPLNINEKFDVTICCEVAEHLHPGTEEILLDTIETHAKDVILFSAAALGQPGHNHINCRPLDFWAEQWAGRNWAPKLYETFSFRALSSYSWIRRNSVILTRVNDGSIAKELWAPLVEISHENFHYYSIPISVVDNPLKAAIPLSNLGVENRPPENASGSIQTNSNIAAIIEDNPTCEENEPITEVSLRLEDEDREKPLLDGNSDYQTKATGSHSAINVSKTNSIRNTPYYRIIKKIGNFAKNKFDPRRKLFRYGEDLKLINSSDLFDEEWYLSNYSDVAAANIDPAYHYMIFGGFEGRNPGPNFDSKGYIQTYSDVKKSGINPLVHYLKYGKDENRQLKQVE